MITCVTGTHRALSSVKLSKYCTTGNVACSIITSTPGKRDKRIIVILDYTVSETSLGC